MVSDGDPELHMVIEMALDNNDGFKLPVPFNTCYWNNKVMITTAFSVPQVYI